MHLVEIPVRAEFGTPVRRALHRTGMPWEVLSSNSDRMLFGAWLDETKPRAELARDAIALVCIVADYNLTLRRVARLAGDPLPGILDGFVWYGPEPREAECEEFAGLDLLFARGWGDCDDLVAARLAELWERGESGAAPTAYVRTRGGQNTWHFQTRRGNGLIEDTSRLLGM